MASLLQQNHSLRDIVTLLNRDSRTMSREHHCNVAKAVGIGPASFYASCPVQPRCQQRRREGRPLAKLYTVRLMFEVVRRLLGRHGSKEQIALTLAALYPKCHGYRVSMETIYNCTYAPPVGELKPELVAVLRHPDNKRVPRSKGQDCGGQIADMLSIPVRLPEIEDTQFPVHCKGNFTKGKGNASAAGALVERTSHLVMFIKLPHPKPASVANVVHAFSDKRLSIALPMRQSWQHGSNENMNGLVWQYSPKGTDLSGSARRNCIPLQMKSTTGLGMTFAYDHHWRSAPNY